MKINITVISKMDISRIMEYILQGKHRLKKYKVIFINLCLIHLKMGSKYIAYNFPTEIYMKGISNMEKCTARI